MSHRSSDRRGLLLMEALVTLLVISTVLGLGLRFLIPMLQIQTRTTERVELQQRAGLLLEAIRRDLARATPGAVTYEELEAERVLAIHLPSDVQPDGRLVWSSELVLYRWGSTEQRLTRSVWNDQTGTVLRTSGPRRLSSHELRPILNVTAPSTMTPWVETFEVQWEERPTPCFPLNLKVVMASPPGEKLLFQRSFIGRVPML